MADVIEGEGIPTEGGVAPVMSVEKANYMVDGARAIRDYFLSVEVSKSPIPTKEGRELFAHLAPFALQADPIDREVEQGRTYAVRYLVIGETDPEVAKALLEDFLGDYWVKTNLFEDASLLASPRKLRKVFPELDGLEYTLAVNPRLMVDEMSFILSLASKERYLPALAALKRGPLQMKLLDRQGAMEYLVSAPPGLRDVLHVAKHYGEIDLDPVMREISTTVNFFRKRWFR